MNLEMEAWVWGMHQDQGKKNHRAEKIDHEKLMFGLDTFATKTFCSGFQISMVFSSALTV